MKKQHLPTKVVQFINKLPQQEQEVLAVVVMVLVLKVVVAVE